VSDSVLKNTKSWTSRSVLLGPLRATPAGSSLRVARLEVIGKPFQHTPRSCAVTRANAFERLGHGSFHRAACNHIDPTTTRGQAQDWRTSGRSIDRGLASRRDDRGDSCFEFKRWMRARRYTRHLAAADSER
jgi:hypothetical protein